MARHRGETRADKRFPPAIATRAATVPPRGRRTAEPRSCGLSPADEPQPLTRRCGFGYDVLYVGHHYTNIIID